MDQSDLSSWLPRRATGFPGEGREELKPTAGKGEKGVSWRGGKIGFGISVGVGGSRREANRGAVKWEAEGAEIATGGVGM